MRNSLNSGFRTGRLLAFLFMMLSCAPLFSQATKDSSYHLHNLEVIPEELYMDVASNPNNCWQVGTPGKTIFSAAYYPNYTGTRAIVTDTLKSYPTNDTSIFYLWQPFHAENCYEILSFSYKIDCDSINDYGWLEVSPDSGSTWYDLNAVDTLKSSLWGSTFAHNKQFVSRQYLSPNESRKFTGTSEQWHGFALEISWEGNLGYAPTSILYKFSFISDDIETNQEGWMIDYILVQSRCPEQEFEQQHMAPCVIDIEEWGH